MDKQHGDINIQDDNESLDQRDIDQKTALDLTKTKTAAYLRKIGTLASTYAKPFDKPSGADKKTPPFDQFTLKKQWLITSLRLCPYLLLVTFGCSFLWDFNQMTLHILGYTYELTGLMRILSVSGLIGFSTNWLAIKMLFKPAKKRPLLGHGLIPAQKERIAYRLATAISRDLINPEIIKKKIHETRLISRYRRLSAEYVKNIIDHPEFRSQLKQLLTDYVNELIADRTIRTSLASAILEQIESSIESKTLDKLAFRTYTFVKGREAQQVIEDLLENLPESIENGLDKIDHLLDTLPEKVAQQSDNIEDMVTRLLYKLINQLDVHDLVQQNIKQLNEERLENLIKGSTNEQLRYIQYLGAILGTIGGLVIWSPLLSITVLGLLMASILLLDYLLVKFRANPVLNDDAADIESD